MSMHISSLAVIAALAGNEMAKNYAEITHRVNRFVAF